MPRKLIPERLLRSGALLVSLLASGVAMGVDEAGFKIAVQALKRAPALDGDSADWLAQGVKWVSIPTTSPSFVDAPADRDASDAFRPNPRIMAGIFENKIYFVVNWQDERADSFYRRWVQQGGKYRRDRRLDDMLALRFHTAGTFSDCMLSARAYTVDVWRWSAGRSQLAGMADDMQHVFSLTPLERAADYATEHGTLYIKKTMDEGDAGWRLAERPAEGSSGVQLGVIVDGHKSGSRADVEAFGSWQAGAWTVELARKLDTGDPDDVRFMPGSAVTGQMAFFNPGYHMQKQITPTLVFAIPRRQATGQ